MNNNKNERDKMEFTKENWEKIKAVIDNQFSNRNSEFDEENKIEDVIVKIINWIEEQEIK